MSFIPNIFGNLLDPAVKTTVCVVLIFNIAFATCYLTACEKIRQQQMKGIPLTQNQQQLKKFCRAGVYIFTAIFLYYFVRFYLDFGSDVAFSEGGIQQIITWGVGIGAIVLFACWVAAIYCNFYTNDPRNGKKHEKCFVKVNLVLTGLIGLFLVVMQSGIGGPPAVYVAPPVYSAAIPPPVYSAGTPVMQ